MTPTSSGAGVHGVIIPKRRSVGLNATVGKTSAGAIEYMPVARVTNIVQTMEYLKKEGLWIACADMKGLDHFDTNMKGPLALVIGSEGDGVSRLVKENCDFTASIPMYGKISSSWTRERDKVTFKIEVPTNTEAEFVYKDFKKELNVGINEITLSV